MTGFLRFIGVMNASIWFGSAIFFTFVAGPAFFSPEMLRLFGGAATPMARAYCGAVAHIGLDRYYLVQCCCGAIALSHLLGDWMCTGKTVPKLSLYILIGAFLVGALGRYFVQPKMEELHYVIYAGRYAPAQRQEAAHAYSILNGAVQTANFLVAAGLLIYTWTVTTPASTPRFTSRNKFRS